MPPPDGGRGLSGGAGDKAIGLRAREEMDVIIRTKDNHGPKHGGGRRARAVRLPEHRVGRQGFGTGYRSTERYAYRSTEPDAGALV
jgi:hypothetical protein